MTTREHRALDLEARRRRWMAGPGRDYQEWRSLCGTWHSVLTDTEAHPGEYRGDRRDPLDALAAALDLAERGDERMVLVADCEPLSSPLRDTRPDAPRSEVA